MAIFEATYEREDGGMFEVEIKIDESICETRMDFWNAAFKKAHEMETDETRLFNLEWVAE